MGISSIIPSINNPSRTSVTVLFLILVAVRILARVFISFGSLNCFKIFLLRSDFTETEDVFLRVTAPTALFWRATNSDESYESWNPFSPFEDLESMVAPWTLSCGNGLKEVCVQVQDDALVSFPICKPVTLIKPPEKFDIELFSDIDLTKALPQFGTFPVAKSGEVYVKLIAPKGLTEVPSSGFGCWNRPREI